MAWTPRLDSAWPLALVVLASSCVTTTEPTEDDDDTVGDDDDDSSAAGLLPDLDCDPSLPVLQDSLVIATDDEFAQFSANYSGTTGAIAIEGAAIATLPGLGCLTEVGGDLFIGSTALPVLDLRGLVALGGKLTVDDNDAIRGVFAPQLAYATGGAAFFENPGLEVLDLRSATLLHSLPEPPIDPLVEGFYLDRSPDLVVLRLDALVQIGGMFNLNDADRLDRLELPALTVVAGDMRIENNGVFAAIEAPLLEAVWGELRVDHNGYTHREHEGPTPEHPFTVDLGAVGTVGGRVYIDNNSSVVDLRLGALASVGGDLQVSGSVALASLGLGALESVGGVLYVSELYLLDVFDLGALAGAGGVDIRFSSTLTSLSAPALESIDGHLHIEHLDALTELDLAALTAVAGDLSILDNGLLPNAVIEALLLQLDGAVGGEIRVEGNGP